MINTPHNPTHQPHAFGTQPAVKRSRSTFNRDHTLKFMFDIGKLIPFEVDEILPGDTVKLNATILCRLTTPLVPLMDNIYIDTHYFYVPARLLWDNWEKFWGAQDNPGDSTDFMVPQCNDNFGATPIDYETVPDYMGIPMGVTNINFNALPLRAYNLIYNEFFRDQDLIDSVDVPMGDGPDIWTDYPIQKRAKRPDYFTTCRPWTQKGPEVNIPLGVDAPVIGIGKLSSSWSGTPSATVFESDGQTNSYASFRPIDGTTGVTAFLVEEDPDNVGYPHIRADLTNATSATINTLRLAMMMQQKLEIDARSGTRHGEFLFAHFGVINPDSRLQRPEYLGGGSQRMDFQTVPNTNLTGTDNADLGAFGLSTGGRHGFLKSFPEFGYVIGILSARADITYQQGLHKMWSREIQEDFYLPAYAHLGEQAVLNQEIYLQSNSIDSPGGDGSLESRMNVQALGFQERWSEYRYGFSRISGRLRSSHPQSLDVWHLSEEFASLPVLSQAFIEDSTPLARALAVQDEPQFLADVYVYNRHTRVMPVRSTPSFKMHF